MGVSIYRRIVTTEWQVIGGMALTDLPEEVQDIIRARPDGTREIDLHGAERTAVAATWPDADDWSSLETVSEEITHVEIELR